MFLLFGFMHGCVSGCHPILMQIITTRTAIISITTAVLLLPKEEQKRKCHRRIKIERAYLCPTICIFATTSKLIGEMPFSF
jgi:hypothetical protein